MNHCYHKIYTISDKYINSFLRRILMIETKIQVDGMSCQHCVMRVKKAIEGLAGIAKSDVQVGVATVAFDESKIQKKDIEDAIVKAGYKIKG